MLHITNGDSAVEGMQEAGVRGDMLAWRDVLHEGPVPAGLSLDALREVRAHVMADRGWAPYPEVLEDFARRDAALEASEEHDEVVLWFEHDLYDQLQLLQLLDWFSGRAAGSTRISLVGVKDYLATLTTQRLLTLFKDRRAVAPEELDLGRKAWAAFRSPDPTALETIMREGTPALPFLGSALLRLLQQYPSVKNGLSLSEENALDVIGKGRRVLHEAFVASHHEREEHIFLGDALFAVYLEGLSRVERPLVLFEDGSVIVAPRHQGEESGFWDRKAELTDAGRAVLLGKMDMVRLNGINRWLGGVYLSGNGAVWRWDASEQRVRYM
jgi:hypothetical protein